jgi:hypothetical protein
VWILAVAGQLLGGGWSPAARSAAKIHGFLLFSGGGGWPPPKFYRTWAAAHSAQVLSARCPSSQYPMRSRTTT